MVALPRRLSLINMNNGWILLQQPVTKLRELRKLVWKSENTIVKGKETIPAKSQQCEIELTIHQATTHALTGLRLADGIGNPFLIG